MPYEYLYNESTHMMHIADLCCYANSRSTTLKHYKSEEAALQDGARFVMCKNCARERDRLMRESVKPTS